MTSSRTLFASLCLLAPAAALQAQYSIGTGEVQTLYQNNCAACHGADLRGAASTSLVDGIWKYGGSDLEIAASIRNGFPDQGMIPWKETLSEQQIRSLVVFLKEKQAMAAAESKPAAPVDATGAQGTETHSFTVENVASIPGILWSIAFLPDATILGAQRDGQLWQIRDGQPNALVKGTPKVWQNGQGGLLEVALHPDYQTNQWIYLSYSESIGGTENGREAGMTAVVRGRIRDGQWTDQQTLFTTPKELHTNAGAHFGSRFVFHDGYLFFGIGDRGRMEQAQDLARPNGKIHRIHDDGRVPADNPFVNTPGALPTIWAYGVRNPQGLVKHPVTGDLWETEHGPRGGDEVNRILPGRNYGWPTITYGINYNGKPITDKTALPGMEQPVHYWVPSIAVCGIDFYQGDQFPLWQNNLLVGGLASEQLHRLVIEDGKVVHDEIILKGKGRIRDVNTGPDGLVYLALDSGSLLRLRPR